MGGGRSGREGTLPYSLFFPAADPGYNASEWEQTQEIQNQVNLSLLPISVPHFPSPLLILK